MITLSLLRGENGSRNIPAPIRYYTAIEFLNESRGSSEINDAVTCVFVLPKARVPRHGSSATIVTTRPELPEAIRTGIVAMVKAARS